MVDERLAEGTRIAQLFASEVEGGVGALSSLAVVDAAPDVDPTPEGTLGYRLADGPDAVADEGEADAAERGPAEGGDSTGRGEATGVGGGTGSDGPLAAVYVHPERVRIEFAGRDEVVASAAEDAGLRVRFEDDPPRTTVFVDDGAGVKRAASVAETAAGAERGGGPRSN